MLPDDERAVNSIARAMIEFDKSNSDKTWKDLARVAYLAMIRHVAYEKISEDLILRGQRV